MNELIPAILVHDEQTFRERLALVEKDFPVIHLDVMDGAFVPNRTWFDVEVLRKLTTPTRIELHLMVENPRAMVDQIADIATVMRCLWHVEVAIDHEALLDHCHAFGKQAGLAISPKTEEERLVAYTDHLDEILVMGSEPGFSGQALQPQTIDRARRLHARWPSIAIGFDISVNAETIPQLKAAGVSRFCAAGAIFKVKDPLAEAVRLRGLI